jgi:hypothetical protein
MSRHECEECGLAACDLPDQVDPEFIFERDDDGVTRCQGCLLRRRYQR